MASETVKCVNFEECKLKFYKVIHVMILPNSLCWVPKITCSSEEVSKKCEEEKAKTNSGQTNQQPHFT